MNSWVHRKPPAQVKILRRPKPVALEQQSQQQQTITNNPTVCDHEDEYSNQKSNNNDSLFEERLLTEPADYNKLVASSITSDKNASQTGSFDATDNCIRGAQTSLQTSIMMNKPTSSTFCPSTFPCRCQCSSYSKQQQHICQSNISQNSHSQKSHQKPHPDQTQTANFAHSNKGDNSASGITKKLMKTYQERADEYAKARLRILGSAFPENEDTSDIADGVDRLLNLDTPKVFTTGGDFSSNKGVNNSDNRNFSSKQ